MRKTVRRELEIVMWMGIEAHLSTLPLPTSYTFFTTQDVACHPDRSVGGTRFSEKHSSLHAPSIILLASRCRRKGVL